MLYKACCNSIFSLLRIFVSINKFSSWFKYVFFSELISIISVVREWISFNKISFSNKMFPISSFSLSSASELVNCDWSFFNLSLREFNS